MKKLGVVLLMLIVGALGFYYYTHASTTYEVLRVVDGDTIHINYEGQRTSVRIIGLDTPETVHPQKPVECMGPEASARAKELLEGQTVTVEIDESQGERDYYNRLLAYIYLPDGANFAEQMIREGFGREYTYRKAYEHQSDFKAAEAAAQRAQRGIWEPGRC